ncbi:MAG: hypothetical protein NVS1B14_05670 [Vulcanimicrobiaceae bacterium]
MLGWALLLIGMPPNESFGAAVGAHGAVIADGAALVIGMPPKESCRWTACAAGAIGIAAGSIEEPGAPEHAETATAKTSGRIS